jgi:tetratricopeptide (TPR) repeat protein
MSPEQALGGSEPDQRSDVYSLGVVLYEMISGKTPYPEISLQSVVGRHLSEEKLTPLAELRDDVPHSVSDAVEHALAVEPDARFGSAREFAEALRLPPSPAETAATGRRRRRLIGAWAAVVAIALLAALWRFAVVRGPQSGGAQTAIAVFPFSVNGGREFAYLGNGMVDLLSANLNGAGDLRSVDAHAVLGSVAFAPASLTPQQGSALAERLGAGLFVTGGIVQSGDRLRIGAALYDRARPDAPLTRATAEGPADRLFELVDALATQLLAGRRGGPGGRLTRLAAVTTRSLPALKLYLEGEDHLRAGRFDSAMQSFDQASSVDTLFALAYYRRAVAADWAANFEAARGAAEEAIRFSNRLSEDDRDLLEAFLAWHRGAADEAEELYRNVLRDHPDNVEAWYNLGEVLFHYSGVRGRSMTQARQAFERALYLDPQMSDARLHLLDIAAKQRDFARFDTLLSQLRTEGPVRLRRRVVLAFAVGSPAARDSAIEELRLANDPTVIISSWGTGIYLEQLVDAERIASLLLEPARPPGTQAYGRLLLAQYALGRGRWRDAERQLDSLAALDSALGLEYRALLSIAPFTPVTDDSLRSLQRQLAVWNAAATKPVIGSTSAIRIHNGVHPLLRQYLLGAVSARLRDERTADGAERELRRVGETRLPPRALSADTIARDFAADLALAVAVQRAWYADRPQDALSAAERIRSQASLERIANSPFFPHLPERFLRAEALHRLGRDREAMGFYSSLEEGRFDAIYLAPTHLRLAEIAEHAGDAQAAALHYNRVADLWGGGDPAAREVAARARIRLAALRKD